eukprot:COSAG06_NODE_21545_length_753_cov_1.500000_2_plen_69_part_01
MSLVCQVVCQWLLFHNYRASFSRAVEGDYSPRVLTFEHPWCFLRAVATPMLPVLPPADRGSVIPVQFRW